MHCICSAGAGPGQGGYKVTYLNYSTAAVGRWKQPRNFPPLINCDCLQSTLALHWLDGSCDIMSPAGILYCCDWRVFDDLFFRSCCEIPLLQLPFLLLPPLSIFLPPPPPPLQAFAPATFLCPSFSYKRVSSSSGPGSIDMRVVVLSF